VREHDPALDSWSEPRIQVILRWQPEDPDRLRWLSEAECAEAAYWACTQYGVGGSGLLTDGGVVPCTGLSTVTAFGGAPETRALFELPDTSPGQIDVCVRQSVPQARPQSFEAFEAITAVGADPSAQWVAGPVTWQLQEVAVDAWPPSPLPPTPPGESRVEFSTTTPQPFDPPLERSTRLTLAGDATAPVLLSRLHIQTAVLVSGEQAWHALQITLARVSATPLEATQPVQPAPERDPNAKPPLWLHLWFPVGEVPADARLRIAGSFVPVTAGDTPENPFIEYVYSDLPLPQVPL